MNTVVEIPAHDVYTAATALHAGPLSMMYEEGRIRYVRVGRTELVRMIYPALRDENWATVLPRISGEEIKTTPTDFLVRYHADYERGDIRFEADYRIEGSANGSVLFSMRGIALSRFQRRRIGLCVLHPIEEYAGSKVQVTRADDSVYEGVFPATVSPHQPFLDVRRMRCSGRDGSTAVLSFEGDVFETEDQRNWSDNTYKTYSTPLSIPAPVWIGPGEVVEQKVALQLINTGSAGIEPRVPVETRHPFPSIGYGWIPGSPPLTASQVAQLRAVPLEHLFHQVNPLRQWRAEWQAATDTCLELNVPLRVSLPAGDRSFLSDFMKDLKSQPGLVRSILLNGADDDAASAGHLVDVYNELKAIDASIAVGYGTGSHYADLNRNRPQNIPYDFVGFCAHPQVHMVDARSLIENAESFVHLVTAASMLANGKPVHPGAVTFSGDRQDPRYHTPFGAWWTLRALCALADATFVTFFALTGREALLDGDKGSHVFELLKQIAAFSPKWIVRDESDAVIFENRSGDRLVFTSPLAAYDAVS